MQRRFLTVMLFLLTAVLLSGAVLAHDEDDEQPAPADHAHVDEFTFDEPLTYYEHIKPIIDASCMGCHQDGQIAGNIVLDTPQALQQDASYIADLLTIRYMPPWSPNPHGTVPLRNPRLLTDEQIAMFAAWAETGAAVGEPVEPSAETIAYELPDVRQDYVYTMPEAYLPDEDKTDDYRCFIADPAFTDPTFVTGFVFEPDQTEQVHHAIIYKVNASVRARADRMNGSDGKAGWACYNDTRLPGGDEEMVGTWTPGTFPETFPDNTGYLMQPGDFFVMQIHYWTGNGGVDDASGFYLQLEEGDSGVTPLFTVPLQAPVEIPCPVGVEGPQCERNYAIQRAAELYGVEFARRPAELLAGCGRNLQRDYSNLDPANAVSSCEIRVPWFLTAVGIYGHMHELGKSIRIELNPDSDNPIVLLDIPAWDFHWQDRYQFVEPVVTKPGDVLRMTCTWDATLAEDPRYIVWGEGTQDEMCFGTLMLLDPGR
ncbi:MAG: hypothetical protein OHK0046_43520 [Anaerolineae bacterium]